MTRNLEVKPGSTRERVLAAVQAAGPRGVTTREVGASVGLDHTSTMYHLDKLRRAGHIVCERVTPSRKQVFWANGAIQRGVRQNAAILAVSGSRRGVYEFIQAHPGASRKDCQEAMGLSAAGLQFHVTRLLAAGLIVEDRPLTGGRGQLIRYTATVKLPDAPHALSEGQPA